MRRPGATTLCATWPAHHTYGGAPRGGLVALFDSTTGHARTILADER